MEKNYSLIGFLSLIISMFIWASSFIGLKAAMTDLGGFTVIFFRMLIASILFSYFIKDFLKYNFTKKDIKYILLLSLFEPCLYFIFETKALAYTSASQAGMITSLMPLITAILAGYFLSELITKKLILGSLIAFLGVIWLSIQSTTSQIAPNPMLGNFLELLAMFTAAGYTIISRYLSSKFSAIFITASQAFIGTIFFFPFFIYEYFTLEMNVTIKAISWTIYLAIAVTMGAYGLYNYALTKIEASKVAIFINLIPVFTLILAFLILDEQLTHKELIACFVIFIGVIISQVNLKKPKIIGF